MMKNYDTDDTFLGRWLAGELSEEERIAFEKTGAYKQFDIINKEVQLLEGPNIDTEKALEVVRQKLQMTPQKRKVISLWKSIAVAAILIVSAGMFLNSSKTHTTTIGETQTITLADGSIINLNANSSLSYKRFFWKDNKAVNLTGEGYFTITKGKGFKVNTSKGSIAVLGTEFNIKDRTDFKVMCYKGKVSFTELGNNNESHTLTKGMQVNLTKGSIEKSIFEEDTPSWRQGISSFENQPLSKVLEELALYFPVEFEADAVNSARTFTGSFNHEDLDIALKSTLTPMGIAYEKSDAKNVIILSE